MKTRSFKEKVRDAMDELSSHICSTDGCRNPIAHKNTNLCRRCIFELKAEDRREAWEHEAAEYEDE